MINYGQLIILCFKTEVQHTGDGVFMASVFFVAGVLSAGRFFESLLDYVVLTPNTYA